jgi:hypothetical protein
MIEFFKCIGTGAVFILILLVIVCAFVVTMVLLLTISPWLLLVLFLIALMWGLGRLFRDTVK